MYSNKENVNIVTALLVAHGVEHVVVCPGSRNAPLVHNFNEHPALHCHPVTDERSAAFFALGLAQATDRPVAVCVTSGTALLNVAPAVAEARYQRQSLIVISADRPPQWIGQLDGQTLPQPQALLPWVQTAVTLPEPGGDEEMHWYCNRLVNEALLDAQADHHPSVHINVPISEPLFQFNVAELPAERIIRRYHPATDAGSLPQPLADDLLGARRPLIVFGQLSPRRFHYEGLDALFSHVIVLHEALAPFTSVSPIDDALALLPADEEAQLLPDVILYVGDAIVSKRLKQFLRRAVHARCWRVSPTPQVEDTFCQLHAQVVADAEPLLQALSQRATKVTRWPGADYRRCWLQLLAQAQRRCQAPVTAFCADAAVQLLEQALSQAAFPFEVHYANSTAIRLANRYAQGHPVWCNRGTNGIEGSLSTAAGFAAAQLPSPLTTHHSPLTIAVIGDLSFFYDQNALWNQHLSPGLRILLLNNGGGAIFSHLPGLEQSAAAPALVAASHHTQAQGICHQNQVDYALVHQEKGNEAALQALQQQIAWLLEPDAPRPRLLEVLLKE